MTRATRSIQAVTIEDSAATRNDAWPVILDWFTSPDVAPAWSKLVDAQHREARQHGRGVVGRLDREHHDYHEAGYSDLLRTAAARPTRDLLDELATEYGLAWVDLSRMIGVSVPAIRKWRMSGEPTADNHERVAQVWAFLAALRRNLGIDEPAVWLGRRLEPGFTVTPRHLWARERVPTLLDMAAGGTRAIDALDQLEPRWREKYPTEDDVVLFDDGMPAIVRRRD